MRRIAALAAGLATAIALTLSIASPANAACSGGSDSCGKVGATEFWKNIRDMQVAGWETYCDCKAYSIDVGSGEEVRYYYAKTMTYTRNIVAIQLYVQYNNGRHVIENYDGGTGGKRQLASDGGSYPYPVQCTGAPC